jgi:hypothetical protein
MVAYGTIAEMSASAGSGLPPVVERDQHHGGAVGEEDEAVDATADQTAGAHPVSPRTMSAAISSVHDTASAIASVRNSRSGEHSFSVTEGMLPLDRPDQATCAVRQTFHAGAAPVERRRGMRGCAMTQTWGDLATALRVTPTWSVSWWMPPRATPYSTSARTGS